MRRLLTWSFTEDASDTIIIMSKLAGPNVVARLRYLEEAAQLLLVSAPTTSTLLGAARIKLTSKYDMPLVQRDGARICNSCGNILILGWSSKKARLSKHESKKRSLEQPIRPTRNTSQSSMAYDCSCCGSISYHKKSERVSRPINKTVQVAITPMQPTSAVQTSLDKPSSMQQSAPCAAVNRVDSASATSRKRVRGRKQEGLQAMLAKSKVQAAPSTGLDFMDFMKTV